jgi:hypothetical protein
MKIDQIWSQVARGSQQECWPWQRARDRTGYVASRPAADPELLIGSSSSCAMEPCRKACVSATHATTQPAAIPLTYGLAPIRTTARTWCGRVAGIAILSAVSMSTLPSSPRIRSRTSAYRLKGPGPWPIATGSTASRYT